MRLNNNGGIVEIESWVDFASNHDSDVEQLINPSQLSIKEESKESIYELSATKKRNIKMLENKSFEHQNFLNSKDFQMECFQNGRTELASFSFNFISKIELHFLSHLPKILKSSMINVKLNPTETNVKLWNTI